MPSAFYRIILDEENGQLRDRLASDGVPLFIATADGTTVIEVKPGGVTVRAPGRPAVNW